MKITDNQACALVDDSFGPAQALRDVWISNGQQKDVAHRLPTLLSLLPTGYTGSNNNISSA